MTKKEKNKIKKYLEENIIRKTGLYSRLKNVIDCFCVEYCSFK